jgi:glycosyltransferase involved in cell wall biosynthesis
MIGIGQEEALTTSRDEPLVSVVMSVFNCEPFLTESVSSVLDQSLTDLEMIIINDGSTDGSGRILDVFKNKDSRVTVYHQENRGLIASLNRGCALARGKYIARMDADDAAVKERLQVQIEFMENHPEVAVLGGAIEWMDTTGKPLLRCFHPFTDREIKAALNRGDCPFSHPTVVMRKKVLAAVKGYRATMVDAEDYDLWLRIADRWQLANLETVVLKYRVHPNQVSVRKCRQQALSNLAARIAASYRRKGQADPFDSGIDISATTLARFGVSESKQQTTVVRGSLSSIRSMCEAGEYAAANAEINEVLRTSDLRLIDGPEIADLRLLAARVQWHRKEVARSILSVGQAVLARPKILGRPIKPLLRKAGLVAAPGERIARL